MIGYLEGDVRSAQAGYLILSCGGVGYRVAATREAIASLKSAQRAGLWTHLAVREDALDLYGFRSEEELRFFELLLTVPGIGPKSALAILDLASLSTLKSAIGTGNASYLTNVSGIGKKTAEKIVLELKDKMGEAASGALPRGDEDALEALLQLGYTRDEARHALRKVPEQVQKSSERLREALKALGSR